MNWVEHTQPFPGFVFPLSGSAEFVFGDTTYILTPNNVVHGGARMELAQKVIGNTKWEYLLVLYRIVGPEPEEFSLSSAHFELRSGPSPRLCELLRHLWKASVEPGGIPAFQTKALFCNVLEELFVSVRNQTSHGAQALFEQVSDYIHEHYNEVLTIPSLAEQNGVNRNRLSYVFHKYAGMGPGEYLLTYRLNRAREMLLAQDVSVRDISQVVGFSDPLYFSRIFKKKFGVSPSAYREWFINNPC